MDQIGGGVSEIFHGGQGVTVNAFSGGNGRDNLC